MDCVQPEAINAFVQPIAACINHHVHHLRIAKVQVRLARKEIVEIVLLTIGVPAPSPSAKKAHPIVRLSPIFVWIQPVKPVSFRVGTILAALDKPWVLIAAVCQNHIDHYFQAALMGFRQ